MGSSEKVIYVAGPYRARDHEGVLANVARAREATAYLAAYRVSYISPHLNSHHTWEALRAADRRDPGDSYWLAATLTLMKRCDAILLLEGWPSSQGSLAEYAEARALGLAVFQVISSRGLKEVVDYAHGRGDLVVDGQVVLCAPSKKEVPVPLPYDLRSAARDVMSTLKAAVGTTKFSDLDVTALGAKATAWLIADGEIK